MSTKPHALNVMLFGTDKATTDALRGFLGECGIQIGPPAETPSLLQKGILEKDGSIIFLGYNKHKNNSEVFNILEAATSGFANEVIFVVQEMDEAVLRQALHLRVFDVLMGPIDRSALIAVFQRAYRQLSAHTRVRSLQTYVAESLGLLSSISLSFGKPNNESFPGATLKLSALDGLRPLSGASEAAGGHNGETDLAVLDVLSRMAKMRRKKFGEMFSDPGWDIVLDLYRHQLKGEAISVTSACHASALAPSTAMRKIAQLEQAGIVRRIKDSRDGRRVLLDLVPTFRDQLEDYLQFAEKAIGDLPSNGGGQISRPGAALGNGRARP